MIVSCYADHLAYTFEAQDALFMLGMKVVNKLEEHHIPMVQVLHNQKVQLLYGVEDTVGSRKRWEKSAAQNL